MKIFDTGTRARIINNFKNKKDAPKVVQSLEYHAGVITGKPKKTEYGESYSFKIGISTPEVIIPRSCLQALM